MFVTVQFDRKDERRIMDVLTPEERNFKFFTTGTLDYIGNMFAVNFNECSGCNISIEINQESSKLFAMYALADKLKTMELLAVLAGSGLTQVQTSSHISEFIESQKITCDNCKSTQKRKRPSAPPRITKKVKLNEEINPVSTTLEDVSAEECSVPESNIENDFSAPMDVQENSNCIVQEKFSQRKTPELLEASSIEEELGKANKTAKAIAPIEAKVNLVNVEKSVSENCKSTLVSSKEINPNKLNKAIPSVHPFVQAINYEPDNKNSKQAVSKIQKNLSLLRSTVKVKAPVVSPAPSALPGYSSQVVKDASPRSSNSKPVEECNKPKELLRRLSNAEASTLISAIWSDCLNENAAGIVDTSALDVSESETRNKIKVTDQSKEESKLAKQPTTLSMKSSIARRVEQLEEHLKKREPTVLEVLTTQMKTTQAQPTPAVSSLPNKSYSEMQANTLAKIKLRLAGPPVESKVQKVAAPEERKPVTALKTEIVRTHGDQQVENCSEIQKSTNHLQTSNTNSETQKFQQQCKICNKVLQVMDPRASMNRSIMTHVRCHIEFKPYRCKICNFGARFHGLIDGHMAKKHGEDEKDNYTNESTDEQYQEDCRKMAGKCFPKWNLSKKVEKI